MSIAVVTLTEVKLIWLMYVGQVFSRSIYTHDKNLPNPKMTAFAKSTFKNHVINLALEPKLPFNNNVSGMIQISFTQLRVSFSNLNFD